MKRKCWIQSLFGISMIGCLLFPGCSSEKTLKEWGDFYYEVRTPIQAEKAQYGWREGYQYVCLQGLTDQGQEKETIIVPASIDGIPIEYLNYEAGVYRTGIWSSEKLRKVFLTGPMIVSKSAFERCPNLEKVIILNWDGLNRYSAGNTIAETRSLYLSSYHYNYEINGTSACYNTTIYSSCYFANVSFLCNYEGGENNGYYWIDDVEYGSRIELLPASPQREGYVFGGWFKEAECVNVWDFEKDTLPEKKLGEKGENVYQETRLYAKWNKQSYE